MSRKIRVYGILSLVVVLLICIIAALSGITAQKDNESEAIVAEVQIEEDVSTGEEIPDEEEPQIETPELIDKFHEHLKYVYENIEKQNQVDDDLLAELESGGYTLLDPLVVLDPYDIAPLSAIAVFNTIDEARISVHVKGKTEAADISFDFDEYNTAHMIPIYGLYIDALNDVTLTATDRAGNIQSVDIEIRTGSLPTRLEKFVIQTYTAQPEKYFNGLNFSSREYFAYDINGDYRWILKRGFNNSIQWNYKDGTMITAMDGGNQSLIFEYNMLGKFLKMLYAPTGREGIHHDIEPMPNGNLLLTAGVAGSGIVPGDTLQDLVIELDVKTGEVVNFLDFTQVLSRYRVPPYRESLAADWLHMNKITYIDGDIIVSMRHQSLVSRISWPDAEIKWLLGNHGNWPPKFQEYLLNPIGEDFEWQVEQHFPIVLPDFDNNTDTIDILLFDNGRILRFNADKELQRKINANEIVKPENYSRMVQFRINEKNMTVEQIWQYGKERGNEWFGDIRGSVQFLGNGNRTASVDAYSARPQHSIFTEVDEAGELVWEMYKTSKEEPVTTAEYRQYRLPIYRKSDNNLHIGERIVNLIPQEILTKYGFVKEDN